MATPPVPPEADALRIARIRQNLSVREAAKRAGVSTSLWRQVEAGYMTPVKGVHTPKTAPAATLARMARAVDLQAEHLESQGQRPDAAEILREIIRQGKDNPAPEPPAENPSPVSRLIEEAFTDAELEPYIQEIQREIGAAILKYGPNPSGEQIFAIENEGIAWDSKHWTPTETVRLLAVFRAFKARNIGKEESAQTG